MCRHELQEQQEDLSGRVEAGIESVRVKVAQWHEAVMDTTGSEAMPMSLLAVRSVSLQFTPLRGLE